MIYIDYNLDVGVTDPNQKLSVGGNINTEAYNRKEYSFIAQELQKVLPELVAQTKREDQVLAVDCNSIIPILTNAIQ